jgi:predicted permease
MTLRFLSRPTRLPRGWALDLKLGVRMLMKYPGLTIAVIPAMAGAMVLAAVVFEIVHQVVSPTLPLQAGDRVVTLALHDASAGRLEPRASFDFSRWRVEARSVTDLTAYYTVRRSLADAGVVATVSGAVMTATGFDVARVPPLIGRALTALDERPEAPPVIVIGYDVWSRQFQSDPQVVGRLLQIGDEPSRIVGVMPEGFAFPVNHGFWVPLRSGELSRSPRDGRPIEVFGRLAAGVSIDQARADAAAMGRRAALQEPRTHEHLRPRVDPYLSERPLAAYKRELRLANVFVVLLLVVVCGNVGLLIFARSVARERELAVRHALGAGRGRIVGQLFAETLVLGGAAALVAIPAAGYALRVLFRLIEAEVDAPLPFWYQPALSPISIGYVALLTLVAAAAAGVLPALKATAGLGARLKTGTPGAGSYRFGGIWTAAIVSQVGVMVALSTIAWYVAGAATGPRIDPGFPAAEYLFTRVSLDIDRGVATPGMYRTQVATILRRFEERLEAEPEVLAVTFADRLPLLHHPHRLIELDAGTSASIAPGGAYRAVAATVALDFFEAVQARPLAGRAFHSGDLAPSARTVIVNGSFQARVLGGANALGRRFRYTHLEELDGPAPNASEWYEIVGVVSDLGMSRGGHGPDDPNLGGIYHPAPPGRAAPVYVAAHVRGDPAAFLPRLRRLAAEVSPALLIPAAPIDAGDKRLADLALAITSGLSGVALLLSLVGIHAVFAFTVTQRVREIGIRVALGGRARWVVFTVLRRPLAQVVAGGTTGAPAAVLFMHVAGQVLSTLEIGGLVTFGFGLTAVGLLGAVVPAYRALTVQPLAALREEG